MAIISAPKNIFHRGMVKGLFYMATMHDRFRPKHWEGAGKYADSFIVSPHGESSRAGVPDDASVAKHINSNFRSQAIVIRIKTAIITAHRQGNLEGAARYLSLHFVIWRECHVYLSPADPDHKRPRMYASEPIPDAVIEFLEENFKSATQIRDLLQHYSNI